MDPPHESPPIIQRLPISRVLPRAHAREQRDVCGFSTETQETHDPRFHSSRAHA
jgi:hypothetical protein